MNNDRKTDDSPRIICLPGWLNEKRSMEPLAELICGEAIDLPGFGGESAPDRVWSVADYAKWVADKITAPVYIAGHSFGGKIAVAVAALYPEKVRGIFVIAGSNRGMLAYRMLRPLIKIAKGLGIKGDRFQSDDYKSLPDVMKKIMQGTLDFDIAPLARRVKCPAVFVYGVNDATTPPALGRKLSDAARGQFFALKGFDHHTIITDGIYQVGAIIRNNTSPA
jgi:pimeloyl-ACP methyl ester carboxylesterase